jgi:predicted nucleotidyltransferase
MERDRIETTALAIADEHGCHSVILYGSRVRGDVDDSSDVDVLLIRDGGPTFRDSRVIDGIHFDVFVYPRDAFAKIDPPLLRILGGQALRERDGLATALLDRVRERFEKGPDPLPADDRTARIAWAYKMLDRIRSNAGIEGDYRRSELVVQALEDYFVLRARWYRGPKVAFPWLLAHDGAAHRAFEASTRPTAGQDTLAALVRAVYGELPAR